MADSSGDLREFRVEIPTRNIAVVPSQTYERFARGMERLSASAKYHYWDDPMRDVWISQGVAHPLVVTGLMALAQGHDLEPICDRLEALQ